MSQQYRTREERKKALSKRKKQPRTNGQMLKKIFMIFIVLGIVGLVSGATTFAFFISDTPKLDETLLKDPLSSTVYDMNGNKIAELGHEKRTYVSYDEIPKVLEDAFIATEDVRFYKHHGVDIVRLAGAVIANFKEGFGAEGASTITQQLAKNAFLKPEKTIKRKVQELWLAIQLENRYSKHEILEMYLNKIYFSNVNGSNIYGVAKAAEVYFGKELKELELHEAALLAGMPQSPNNYNPLKHPEAAEKRRNIVLDLMAKHGFISKEEAEKAKAVAVQSTLAEPKKSETPYYSFLDQVIEEVSDYGKIDVFSAGLKIYTTLDPDAQSYVEELLDENSDIPYPDENFQAGIALLDTQTGEIRALGGGRNHSARGFNYATDTKRQPGSTIKPILDYGPAVEYLKWSTYHQIVDGPYTYSDGTKINNHDRQYMGKISIRTALAKSRNIPALKALQAVGLDRARDFAVKLGIPLEERIFESYAIGGFNKGVSPLQLAGAYSAFGNNGVYVKPHAVKKIVFPDGTEIDMRPEPEVVMKDYTAFMITDMLMSVVEPGGTGVSANVPGLNIAGKTGTTNFDESERKKYGIPKGVPKDIWFAGYTPHYTAAIWTGYKEVNEESYMKTKSEQQIAKQLFKKVIGHVSKNVDNKDFPVPKSVVKVAVEKGTDPAKLASDFTPKDKITYEYFVRGTEPTQVSDRYKKLEKPSNLTINYNQQTNEITLSWEYPEEWMEGVQFEISQSIDEGPYQVITTTGETAISIPNPIPGAIYKFNVVAFSTEINENRSDPAAAAIEIPVPIEDHLDDLLPGQDDNESEEVPGNEHGQPGEDGENGSENGQIPFDPSIPPVEPPVQIVPPTGNNQNNPNTN
jgi:penicillin-binding protein 1A